MRVQSCHLPQCVYSTVMEGVVLVAAVWACLLPQVAPTPVAQGPPIQAADLLAESIPSLLRSGSSAPAPCSTPEGEQGVCDSATSCSAYQSLLNHLQNNTVLLFFRQRVCKHGQNFVHVCCPNNPKLQPSSIFFLTPDKVPPSSSGSSLRPSQRPNARQPSQPGLADDSGDARDEAREPLSTSSPQPPIQTTPQFLVFHHVQPTPSPVREPSASVPLTPPTPTRVPSPQTFTRVPFNPSTPAPQNLGQPPTEPQEPQILPAEGECGTMARGSTGNTPWVVGIGVLSQEEFQVNCGGALVSRLHVIAAAHCMQEPTPNYVRLGDPQRQGNADDIPVLTYTTAGYNPDTRENNLALITLARPVTYRDNIKPVCLPFRYRLDGFRGQVQHVVGWTDAGTLETGEVEILGPAKCRATYGSPAFVSNNNVARFSGSPSSPSSSSSSSSSSSAFSSLVSPRSSSAVSVDRRNLCGTPISSASARSCLSNYGAPLFFHDEETTGLHFLTGVSSIGDNCQAGPGLYTRLGAYLPWLSQQLSRVESPAPNPAPSQASPRRQQAFSLVRG